jgi:hypothetical protein
VYAPAYTVHELALHVGCVYDRTLHGRGLVDESFGELVDRFAQRVKAVGTFPAPVWLPRGLLELELREHAHVVYAP